MGTRHLKKRTGLFAVLAGGLLIAGTAHSLPSAPSIFFSSEEIAPADYHSYGEGTSTFTTDNDGVQHEEYTWILSSPLIFNDMRVDSWEMTFDPDPYVANNMTVTNTSSSNQIFSASALLPIPAYAYNEVISSSIGVSATDVNGDGTLYFSNLTPPSSTLPLYSVQVNGATALEMNPNSNALPLTVADCGGPGCTAVSSGYVAQQFVPAGVATSIGLEFRFILSPGDSASVTGRFEIIPEPGTALLLGAGLVGLGLRGRRA